MPYEVQLSSWSVVVLAIDVAFLAVFLFDNLVSLSEARWEQGELDRLLGQTDTPADSVFVRQIASYKTHSAFDENQYHTPSSYPEVRLFCQDSLKARAGDLWMRISPRRGAFRTQDTWRTTARGYM